MQNATSFNKISKNYDKQAEAIKVFGNNRFYLLGFHLVAANPEV